MNHQTIFNLLEDVRTERDVDKRAEILRLINAMLPDSIKLDIPSLITNDYINFAIYKIEESLVLA